MNLLYSEGILSEEKSLVLGVELLLRIREHLFTTENANPNPGKTDHAHITEQLLKNQSSKIHTPRNPLTVLRPCGQEDNTVRLYDHYFHIGLGTEIPSSAAEPVPKFGMERNGIIRKTVSLLLCLIGALL